ncbi:MAG: hypothetical protein JHD16_13485, partial [Solirubrobacteraceae bacterium]|nr:hypothetical protein [Solirubrobacteraceae bacterium]
MSSSSPAAVKSAPGPVTVAAVMSELRELADPKILAVNQNHGDDHAVNLT